MTPESLSSFVRDTIQPLAPALLNHLWQSTAFAAAIWLATLLLRRNQARIRYTLWLAASLKFFVPFALLIALGGLLPKPQQTPAPAMVSAIDLAGQPFSDFTPLPIHSETHAPTLRERVFAAMPLALAALWLCGFATVLLVWAARWRQVAATRRRALPAPKGRELEILRRTQLRISYPEMPSFQEMPSFWRSQNPGIRPSNRPFTAKATESTSHPPIPLFLSQELMEPGIFGILRPALVWPERLSARLTDEHIEAVFVHELMHARRRDNLTAALHMLVEAAFWFHPLVWWIERRLIEERERACDEAVVALCGSPEAYAEGLLKTCRFCIESPLPCVSGITGADLSHRVRSIVTLRLVRLSIGMKILLAAFAFVAIAGPLVFGEMHATLRTPFRGSGILTASTPSGQPELDAVSIMPSTPNESIQTESAPQSTPASAKLPEFEVATIKPNDRTSHGGALAWSQTSRNELKIMGSLKTLLKSAYGIEDVQIAGGPKWLDSQLFDIDAKASSLFASPAEMQLMLRALLQQRFKLSTHTDTHSLPVYSLVVAKGGPKMQRPDTFSRPAGYGSGSTMVRGTLDTDKLAHLLTPVLGRTVIDNTGLHGNYKIDLTWAADDQPSGPSLFTAIQEQLGLKLEPTKGPVETLVIDHAEQPSMDGAKPLSPPTPTLKAVAFAPQTSATAATPSSPLSFGVVTGSFPVGDAAGKRVRFSAWIKTEDVRNGYAGLWWRVDGPGEGNNRPQLAFDNSVTRYIDGKPDTGNGNLRGATGTTPWTYYQFELPVGKTASNINFGVLFTGTGAAWVDAMKVELDGQPYNNPPFDFDFESPKVKGFYAGCGGVAGCTDYKVDIDDTTAYSGHQSLKMQFVAKGSSRR